MKLPKLDRRSREDLLRELRRLARSYTPEWRWEGTEDDPGAALAELFCDMHYETLERMNLLPEKLYLEFLREIGFREPDPGAAGGVMRFMSHPALDYPVPVPCGTQAFTPDENGDNIVYETTHMLESTSAELRELYYADGKLDELRRITDFTSPHRLFDPAEGEAMQCHRFSVSQNDVLRLSGPATVTLRMIPPAAYTQNEAAERLAQKHMVWYYYRDGEKTPFDAVRAENGCVVLEKRRRGALEARPVEANGEALPRSVFCEGKPEQELLLSRVELTSAPLETCPAEAFAGDIPIVPSAGGDCFSRRPAPYSALYLRSDETLSKKGASALLRLELTFRIDEPPKEELQYEYGPNIIELQTQGERKLDDVYVSGVLWEYFNGLGWRQLAVEGDVNPFTGKDGSFALRFRVPDDLEETEVNALTGLYLRARVTEVEHLESLNQRWLIPFLRSASFSWEYTGPDPAAQSLRAENNGEIHELFVTGRNPGLRFPAFTLLDPSDRAMYLRFEGSPHAMPLSVRFRLRQGAPMEKLQWEAWDGKAFVPVQCLDGTENLSRSGVAFLYLPEPLPERELFGQTGCWLRLSLLSERRERSCEVLDIELNTVEAVQRRREPEQTFDTELSDTNKELQLLSAPVQRCEVWVDEMSELSDTEAIALSDRSEPGAVELEPDGRRVNRCWIKWQRIGDLTLSGPNDRVYELDAYAGVIRFGDGRHGKLPPQGDHNIRVRSVSGGGARGNVPAGRITGLLTGLPRISTAVNTTPMSGGTNRWSTERIDELGNRRLRHQGRAVSAQDFEDIVRELFPRVRHVRCFSGRDEEGSPRRSEVTVVIAGDGEREESMERLCREVRLELLRRCSCCMAAENRLYVRPARVITVNTTVLLEVAQMEYAAQTQQEVADRIEELISQTWQRRMIGEQLNVQEIWTTVRETGNVRGIRRVLADGSYDDGGLKKLIALEQDTADPYAVVTGGVHMVRIVS